MSESRSTQTHTSLYTLLRLHLHMCFLGEPSTIMGAMRTHFAFCVCNRDLASSRGGGVFIPHLETGTWLAVSLTCTPLHIKDHTARVFFHIAVGSYCR